MGTRPYVISRHGLTMDGRILDWDLPIPQDALLDATTTLETAESEAADLILTGADTMWPLPPRWSIAPGRRPTRSYAIP